MTGFDGLGKPEGNKYSQALVEDALEGRTYDIAVRRAGQALGPGGGAYETALGTLGASGKAIVDSTLGLGKGLMWLGTAGQADLSWMPNSLTDMLPTDMATKLDSRIEQAGFLGDTGEVTGHLLSLMGGGWGGGASKGVTATERVLNKALGEKVGGAMARAGEKAASLGTLPGKALKALEWPGRKVGEKLGKMPGVREWTAANKEMLTDMIATSGGFGLYNFVQEDGDLEARAGALLHGLFAGAAFKLIGKGADGIERRMLEITNQKKLEYVTKSYAALKRGEPISWQQFKEMVGPRAASTAFEGLGWAALDSRFTEALLSNDWKEAANIYAQSLPGALLARTGRVDYWETFRRAEPEVNNFEMRRQIIDQRRRAAGEDVGPVLGNRPPGSPKQLGDPGGSKQLTDSGTIYGGEKPRIEPANNAQEPQYRAGSDMQAGRAMVPQGEPYQGEVIEGRPIPRPGPIGPERQIENTDTIYQGYDPGTRAIEAGATYPGRSYGFPQQPVGPGTSQQGPIQGTTDPVGQIGDRLVQAGWDIPDGVPAPGTYDLEIPGTPHKLTLHSPDGVQLERLVVPAHVFNAVRKMGAKSDVTMDNWAVIEEFIGDLAAVSQMRQMAGELRFQGESSAGGQFKDGDRVSRVGLDGKKYSQQLPVDKSLPPVVEDLPEIELTKEPQTPELARWLELAKALRSTARPTPDLDVIEAAIVTAIEGNPESPSVQELQKFFNGRMADEIAHSLGPDNMTDLANYLGRLGSGHATAEELIQAGGMTDVTAGGAKEDPMLHGQQYRDAADQYRGQVAELEQKLAKAKTPKERKRIEKAIAQVQKDVDYHENLADHWQYGRSASEAYNDPEGRDYQLVDGGTNRYSFMDKEVGTQPFRDTWAEGRAAWHEGDKPALKRQKELADKAETGLVENFILGKVDNRNAMEPMTFRGRGVDYNKVTSEIPYKGFADVEVGGPEFGEELVKRGGLDEAAARELLKDYEGEEIDWAVQGLKDQGVIVPLGKVQAEGVRDLFASAEGGWHQIEDIPAALFEIADNGEVRQAAEHKKAHEENDALWEPYSTDRWSRFLGEVGKQVQDILSTPSAAREKRLAELRKEYFEGEPKPKRKKELEKLIAGLSGAPEAANRKPIESKDKSGDKTRSLLTEIRERGGIELPGKKEIGVSSPSKEYGNRGKGIFKRGGVNFADLAGELAAEGWFGPDAQYKTEGTSYDPEGALRTALVEALGGADVMHPGDKGAMAGMERAAAQAGTQRTDQFWNEQKDLHDATKFDGEGGFLELSVLGSIADLVFDVAKNPLASGKIALDFLSQNRAEIIRKALPGDTLADEIHRSHARRRRHRGEATALWKPGEKVAGKLHKERVELHPKTRLPAKPGESTGQSWEARVPGVSKVEVNRWELLADKDIEAKTDAEKAFQEAAQRSLRYLWEEKRKVGGVQGTGSGVRMLSARERQVMPRMWGRDRGAVMSDPELRRAWFDVLEILNPGKVDAKALERSWETREDGVDVVAVDRKTHLEKIRAVEVEPMSFTYKGKRYEMRVSDPTAVMKSAIQQQSGEIASTEQWGQDIDQGARDRLERVLANEPDGWQKVAVQANLARGGTQQRRDLAKRKLTQQKIHPMRRRFVDTMIDHALELAQGGSLDTSSSLGGLARFVKGMDALPRAIMTLKAPVWDAPEYFVLPLIAGRPIDAWNTFKQLLGRTANWSLAEALEEYQRSGAITAQMHALMFEEAHNLLRKATKAAGYLGEKAEVGKAFVMATMADVMLSRWAQRQAHRKDAVSLAAIDMPPAEAQRLMSGDFTQADADLFRTQFVRYWTRRSEQGEGVAASDDPVMSATFRFMRFYNQQAAMMRKAAVDVVQGKEGTVYDRLGNLLKTSGGFLASNTIGFGILAGLLSGLLSGDEPEDIKREVIEKLTTPAGWREIAGRTMLGGPLESTASAMVSPTVRDTAQQFAPWDMFLGWRDFIRAIDRGEGVGAVEQLVRGLHLVPLEADVFNRRLPRMKEDYLAVAAGRALGHKSLKSTYISNRDLVLDFLSGPGQKRGLLWLEQERSEFAKTKTHEFYDKVEEAMDVWMREEPVGQGWDKARALFQEAVNQDESSPESVAGWIRSRRMHALLDRSDATWADFVEYAGEERATQIDAHDRALTLLARHVGRLEGELPAEWEGRMEELRRVLATGGGEHKDMVDEAVERAARAYRDTGSKDWEEIEEVSRAIANHRDPLIDIAGEDVGAALWARPYERRVRYLRGKLTQRAIGRIKKKREDER